MSVDKYLKTKFFSSEIPLENFIKTLTQDEIIFIGYFNNKVFIIYKG